MIFIFRFVNMVYHIREFFNTWNKLNLIMVYEIFDVLLKSVC